MTEEARFNETVAALSEALDGVTITAENRDHYYAMLQRWRAQIAEQRDLADALEAMIAATVVGTAELGGTKFRSTRSVSRKNWDNDALLRTVMDSRLVDRETGEITPETPIQKLHDVFPMTGSNARITALRARGIDPDRYCDADYGRLKLVKVRER